MWCDDTREGRNMKKPKWRQHLRGTCKWGGVTLCVLISGLWIYSAFRAIVWARHYPDGSTTMMIIAGGTVTNETGIPPILSISMAGPIASITSEWTIMPIDPPVWYGIAPPIMLGAHGFHIFRLWIPLIIIAPPTISLFCYDTRTRRRKRLGQCITCGYDLTGNQSGTCPECGATTTARAASS